MAVACVHSFMTFGFLVLHPSLSTLPVYILIVEIVFFLLALNYQSLHHTRRGSEWEARYHQVMEQMDTMRNWLGSVGGQVALEGSGMKVPELASDFSPSNLNLYLQSPLSGRELEVIKAVSKGGTNKEVAEALFISVNTVKTHLIRIYEKLEVSNRTEAALKANEMNLLN